MPLPSPEMTGPLGREQALCNRLFEIADTKSPHKPLAPVMTMLLRSAQDGSVVIIEPHADDGAIACGGLAVALAELGVPVVQVLLFSGYRSGGFPSKMDKETRRDIRVAESEVARLWLGTSKVEFLNLKCYERGGYHPSEGDREKITDIFLKYAPSTILVPGASDTHPAHRAARALAAYGMVTCDLRSTHVMTYWAPWGPVARPNAYHVFDDDTAFRKKMAVKAYSSQELNGGYAEYADQLSRVFAPLLPQLQKGPYEVDLSSGQEATDCVELYRVEQYEPVQVSTDPIQAAIGLVEGELDDEVFFKTQEAASNLDALETVAHLA